MTPELVLRMNSRGQVHEPKQRRVNWLARFARDVAVSVTANLITAAIIYLVATYAGVISSSPDLVLGAFIIVAMSASIALYVVSKMLPGHRGAYAIGLSMLLLGLVGIAAPLTPESGLDATETVLYPIGGTGAIITGIATILQARTERD
jgi:hypothetical protein